MTEQPKANPVGFKKRFTANMMAMEGTSLRPCTMLDASDTGARLAIDGWMEGRALKEFLVVLSTVGKAYRRCELAWVNGNEAGVHFIKAGRKKTRPPGG